MYNGIGLPTPRGSGTNGYVQRNLAHVKKSKHMKPDFVSQPDGNFDRAPNYELIAHQKRRQIEAKCLSLRESLERDGYSESKIERKVDEYRQRKLKDLSRLSETDRDDRIKRSFKISRDRVDEVAASQAKRAPEIKKETEITGRGKTSNKREIEDLDDHCLTRIICHALTLSSLREEDPKVGDNVRMEKNLSLVSKRWYFLTQAQVPSHGVLRLNLDKISRGRSSRSNALNSVNLFRKIQSKLLKYKHLQFDGSLTCDELRKLIVALDTARVENLDLRIKVDEDGTSPKDFAVIPKQLTHIKRLSLVWFNDIKNEFSNALTWTIFERATRLRILEVYLLDGSSKISSSSEASSGDHLEKTASKFLGRNYNSQHDHLEKIIFKRATSYETSSECSYTNLMRRLLSRELSISQVDTDDSIILEYLIKSSIRSSTSHHLKTLNCLTPLGNNDFLARLLSSKNLGTNHLSLVIDNVDQIEELRHLMYNFRHVRIINAVYQIRVYLKDQKFSSCEEIIKNLIYLCRVADITIHFQSQQRVSIDCCHLMWSIGRALQSSDMSGKCLFKITIQNPLKQGTSHISEITIPFGNYIHYNINSNREDLTRYKEIMKSVKKDSYHQFVKSVRDNLHHD